MPKTVSKVVAPKTATKKVTKTVAPKLAPKTAPSKVATPKPAAPKLAVAAPSAAAPAATQHEASGPTAHAARPERRRNTRFPLGLPVHVTLVGQAEPMTVELTDLSMSGGRFRGAPEPVSLDQVATFSFLLPGQKRCQVRGKVVRSDGGGEFALRFTEANRTFLGFVGHLGT